jgi:hypothetical protein
MSEMQERLTLDAWRAAGSKERAAITKNLESSSGSLKAIRTAGEEAVPVFVHEPSRALFHLVPGGTWRLGFSPEEHEAVYQQYRGWWEADTDDQICEDRRQLPGPYTVTLPAFLLAARPFDPGQIELLRSDQPAPPGGVSEGRKVWDYEAVVKLPADKYVRYLDQVDEGTLSDDELDAIEARLRLRGLRLPTNDEWEAAARAGGATPFPTGVTIPKSPKTGVNRFGFVDMGAWPEVVAGSITDGPKPVRPIRGGAAMVYPGQDCGEWTLMLSAMRVRADEFAEMLHVRPAMEIP